MESNSGSQKAIPNCSPSHRSESQKLSSLKMTPNGLLLFFYFFIFSSTTTAAAINADTTWSSQSQVLSGEVQIADSITLTISPGLSVEDTNFFVQGVLIVDGDPGAPVSLTNTTVSLSDNSSYPGKLDIEYAVIEGGTVPAMGHGLFSIRDSHFKNMSRFYVWYPDSGSEFLRNIFEDSAGLSIGVIGNLIIENNAFVRPSTTYAIENWANYGRGLRLMNNSFLDGSTVELRDGYDNTFIDAGSNYWGTTKECRIEDRIKDRNDSLTYASAINYQPILSEQHADTPISDGALDLDANCPTPTTVIVLEDTTWSSQSQVLSGEVQIADSITLTISPGLSVEDTNFFVQGVLIVDGDPGAPVSLTNTTVSLSDNSSYPGKLDIEYAVIEGGQYLQWAMAFFLLEIVTLKT